MKSCPLPRSGAPVGKMSSETSFLCVDVAEAMVAEAGPQIKAACPPGCFIMAVEEADNITRFIIEVPQDQEAAVRAALERVAAGTVTGAGDHDIQALHDYKEGRAEAEIDF